MLCSLWLLLVEWQMPTADMATPCMRAQTSRSPHIRLRYTYDLYGTTPSVPPQLNRLPQRNKYLSESVSTTDR